MLVIVGYIVVVGSVFGGFVMSGGHLAVLFQPLELLMIGGAAGLVLAVLGFWLLRRRLSSKSTRVAKVQSRERKGRRKK